MLPRSTALPSASPSTCARCGASFHCGRDDAAGCWCACLPALDRVRYDAAAGCLCKSCLRAATGAPTASSLRATP
ncbi:MAG: cysteine-rich CWC family protein [Burkholderiaceae bacterium]